ncbi:hypothetical protein FKM82_030044 [Ascaphus truei]
MQPVQGDATARSVQEDAACAGGCSLCRRMQPVQEDAARSVQGGAACAGGCSLVSAGGCSLCMQQLGQCLVVEQSMLGSEVTDTPYCTDQQNYPTA